MQGEYGQSSIMLQGSVKRVILSLALPSIGSMLVTSIYNIADAYFISKISISASASVGIVLSVMAVIQAVGFAFGMGSASRISILLGKEEKEQAEVYASSAFVLSILAGCILAGIGLWKLKPLMRFLGSTDTILPYAIIYGRYILGTAPVMCGCYVLNNLLRAEGKAKFACIAVLSGCLLNIFLDYLLINIFSMGIHGGGLATLISQILSFGILLYWYLAKRTWLLLSLKNVGKEFLVYWEIIKYGFSSFLRQGLTGLATFLLNTTMVSYGDAAVAGVAVAGRIFLFLFSAIVGFVQGYSPVVGYHYGDGNMGKVRKALGFSLKIGVVVTAVLGVVTYVGAGKLIAYFVGNDLTAVEIGTKALQYQCVVMPFIFVATLCNQTYQAMGKAVSASFMASCRQGIFYVPAILGLPVVFGVTGGILAQPVADVLSFLASVPFLLHLRRRKGLGNDVI